MIHSRHNAGTLQSIPKITLNIWIMCTMWHALVTIRTGEALRANNRRGWYLLLQKWCNIIVKT